MNDYRCPRCRKLHFRGERVRFDRLEVKCRCGQVVTPRVLPPMHGTYECMDCGREWICEAPRQAPIFCIECGTYHVQKQSPQEAGTPDGRGPAFSRPGDEQ